MKQELFTQHGRVQVDKIEDRFEIVRVLGQGTAGTVYHVRDKLRGNRELALKILSNSLAYKGESLARFIDELKICSGIRHRNIVQAYELVEGKDCIGYTMELINGCDLRQLQKSAKFTYSEVDQIMYQLLEGLSELHRLKIMHRDIKLENIILSEDGIIKISDLGLVKKLERKVASTSSVLLGTPQYMAPEYIKSAWFDERSDIYSCGVVLFELLSGKRRLPDKNGDESIRHLLSTQFEIPKISVPKEYSKYHNILQYALAVSPDGRFQTSREMQAAFSQVEPVRSDKISAKVSYTKNKIQGKNKRLILKLLICFLALLVELFRP